MTGDTGSQSKIAKDEAKIWLDTSPDVPVLGFDRIAQGLADIITKSDARFAVGIFGGWGSGKSTLMNEIRRNLAREPGIVCVDFNAWRFEREPSLLVPLLDTIRDELARWAKDPAKDDVAKAHVTAATRRMARVVRGLATGLSVEVGIPGAVKVGYDLNKGMSAMEASNQGHPDKPQSLYFAAFHELARATREFSNAIRVVVFVDDLDRCLPGNALEILESMKLFFDIPGFIFVAGLDESVVQHAVKARLFDASRIAEEVSTRNAEPGGPESARIAGGREMSRAASRQLGRDYLEKIFQVPYYLPQATTSDLEALLASMYEGNSSGAQWDISLMRRYLKHVSVNGRIIPREVKRFLNACTLQMLTRKDLNPNVVLALQVLTFRYEWRSIYEEIQIDWVYFVEALSQFLDGDDTAIEDLSTEVEVSPDLERYLRSPEFRFLAVEDIDLEPYLSSMDAAGVGATGQREAYRRLGLLRRESVSVLGAPVLQGSDRDDLINVVTECLAAMESQVVAGGSFDSVIQGLAKEIQKLRGIHFPGQSDEDGVDKFISGVKDSAEKISRISSRIRRELRANREPRVRTPAPPAVLDRESYFSTAMGVVEAALIGGWRLDRQVPLPGSGYQLDGVIRSGRKTIAVETVFNPDFIGGELSRAIIAARRSTPPKIDAALIIARSPRAPGFRRLDGDLRGLGVPYQALQWEPGAEGDRALTAAVQGLIRDLEQEAGAPES